MVWRKHILQTIFSGEWKKFRQQIQQEKYDWVIDAQGLLKSALITRLARGDTYGLDKNSAREPLASRFYQFPQAIAKQQHAVERVRELFAVSLGYQLSGLPLDYGIADHAAAHKARHESRQSNESRDNNETLTPAKQTGNNMMPGATPGSVPGSIPGSMPGTVPGSMPGTIPGTNGGSQPGSMQNMKR